MNKDAKCCDDPRLRDLMEPDFFKALGDPTRVAIMVHVSSCCGSRTVGEISDQFPVSTSVVSRHLAILRDAGILKAERKGKEVFYTVRWEKLVRALRCIADAIESCCGSEDGEHGHG